ncbi:MAG: ABC transporter permease [Deltaproteobacteria bacterium]|nr:ABC transporter permease [Deltaproteobacteria bacterium]
MARALTLPIRRPGLALAIAVVVLELVASLSAPLWERDPFRPDLTGTTRVAGREVEVVSIDGLPVGPCPRFPMGADMMGRDVFARLLHGTSVSLGVGLFATLLGLVLGLTVGVVAGYFGGPLDTLLSRSMDVVLAFPILLFAVALATALEGSGAGTSVVVIALATWPYLGRLVRAEVLRLRALPFVEAARAVGGSHARVVLRHLLPNLAGPLLAFGTLSLASNILFEAALSYLGVGVPPPTPSWGGMIRDGVPLYNVAWWITVFPGLAIVATALAWNTLGEALERRFVPSRRSR